MVMGGWDLLKTKRWVMGGWARVGFGEGEGFIYLFIYLSNFDEENPPLESEELELKFIRNSVLVTISRIFHLEICHGNLSNRYGFIDCGFVNGTVNGVDEDGKEMGCLCCVHRSSHLDFLKVKRQCRHCCQRKPTYTVVVLLDWLSVLSRWSPSRC
ncbi:hypothetical protein C1H46_008315 [Malus baccata]|uniref:Uncharacterized protein n=1 Tax=Malus baccata TaxID=106549 RepID=A0A540N513_MALBA|nr:hypothetical protein C1H46_008315 [Malus baccata]